MKNKFNFYASKKTITENNDYVSNRIQRRKKIKTSNRFSLGQTISNMNGVSERDTLHQMRTKRKKVFKLLSLTILLTVVLVWVLYELMFKFNIVNKNVKTPITEVQLNSYSVEISKYFKENPIERFYPFLNKDKFDNYIRKKIPEIESVVSVDKHFLSATEMSVNFRKPMAMWVSNGNKYYVDKFGTAFVKSYFGDPKLEIVDKSGIKISEAPVVSQEFLGFIGKMISISEEKNYSINKLIIPPAMIKQIDVYIQNYNYPIKMITNRPPAEQVEDMYRTLNYLKANNISPAYVDVRIKNKAYYK